MTAGLAWHAVSGDEAVAAMRTDAAAGLGSDAALQRLHEHGPNQLPRAPRQGPVRRFLRQFHNLLIYVLLASGVLAALLGHAVDAAVIFAVVLVNAVIGFVQEGRAEQALDAIRALIEPRATVIRDGRRTSVPADSIVPGDLVMLEAGDRVPADLRLLRSRNLRIDEAILTGESVAVEKDRAAVAASAALAERTPLAYSGTFVVAGQGVGVAIATGTGTELGRISEMLGEVESLETPLIRRMNAFARQVTVAILAVCGATWAFAVGARGYDLSEAFMVVVGMAVSAIPEGLPAIMTITLAIGVRRMAARNAIIRRLPAVETLGSVSVICSDKTGTLTRNEMSVVRAVTASRAYEVTGSGYEPRGVLRAQGVDVDAPACTDVLELARAALLCNDAELRRIGESWLVDGDPMEGALLAFAIKAGLDPRTARRDTPRRDEIPFDAAHRFMATLHHRHDDGEFVLVKGAPERILDMCDRVRAPGGDVPLVRDEWQQRSHALAADGHRVLAFAVKPMPPGTDSLTFDAVTCGATLLGLTGFIDPPREEAVGAIAECAGAGIRVVMITGDHVVTAREIARQLGLAADPVAMSGMDIEALDDAGLRATVQRTHVFARATPEHKLRLVGALQSDGLTVAMTGDGVNDAPALKRADVGVAMGRKGTEVAKAASEMVLTDDNFASIVAAVREGRTVYDNLVKTIGWTLPTNGGETLTIVTAVALGLALPITPVQILWINMITAVALGLTLAFEPTEPGTMRRPPRPPGEPILSRSLIWRILFVSLLFVGGAFGAFFWAEQRGMSIEAARTLCVNTIVAMEIAYLFSVRYVHGSSLTLRGVVGTPAVLIGVGAVTLAQFALTYAPPMQRLFRTEALGAVEFAVAAAVGAALLFVVELEKRARRAIGVG